MIIITTTVIIMIVNDIDEHNLRQQVYERNSIHKNGGIKNNPKSIIIKHFCIVVRFRQKIFTAVRP